MSCKSKHHTLISCFFYRIKHHVFEIKFSISSAFAARPQVKKKVLTFNLCWEFYTEALWRALRAAEKYTSLH
jgi:hypothetical protein